LGYSTITQKGSKIANAQNEDGESALILATKLQLVSKAIELIDALMYSGAFMYTYKSVRHFGHVLFFACSGRVDPVIFDKFIMWNAIRKNRFEEWWSQCDSSGNGVFVLACGSQNFSLIEHIISLPFTQHRQEKILQSMPNHIEISSGAS
jgi:hypothetical protein